ncbi:ATP-binding cassette domain-containing protein [Herbaspirillum sp.]|uniref:ABC transporter ATP-binding protein n=1 Tax=Herbaspirillum sp. TaxID=1890675 RepID=UPI0025C66B5A|nr:ATP-binding cassette domain-containing protein [Herbaspirillum sp.]
MEAKLKQEQVLPARMEAVGVCSPVVAPVSFSVVAGQCLSVSGRSGAGKTRLLRLVADLDEGGGDVMLDGVSRSAFSAPDWRRQVLYQSAEPAWWRPSVAAHFEPEELELATQLADRLALPAGRLEADISQLSTGERQRAALIRSLAKRPKALLLDEPTSALDADNARRVEALLLDCMNDGLALVLVTHSQEQAARLAGSAILIEPRR